MMLTMTIWNILCKRLWVLGLLLTVPSARASADGTINQVLPTHEGIEPVDVGDLTAHLLTGINGASLMNKEGKNKEGKNKEEKNKEGWVYDLQGRRVNRPQKGVYISAGRKIVIN
jgi:hypothetical protein